MALRSLLDPLASPGGIENLGVGKQIADDFQGLFGSRLRCVAPSWGGFEPATRHDGQLTAGDLIPQLGNVDGARKRKSVSRAMGFVTKFNALGTGLLYSTYLGGATIEAINGIAVDSAGNAYVAGTTGSSDFPVISGAYQSSFNGGSYDAFVAKLNAAGTALLFSTYLGGTANDAANAIAIDAAGKVYVAGDTYSTDFPRFNGFGKAYNSTAFNSAFVTILKPDATDILMSTYFGGQACLAPGVYSCNPQDPNDAATGIAVDPSGNNIYVAGYLSSVVVVGLADSVQSKLNGTTDAFAAKIVVDPFTNNILNFRYATRLGGNDSYIAPERAYGLGIDAKGDAYVVGTSSATSFPVTQGAFHSAISSTAYRTIDAFVFKLSTLGTPISLDGACGLWDSSRSVQLRATLALNDTGNVTFVDGGTTLATVPIANGSAQFSGTATPGVHKYSAVRTSDGTVSSALYCAIEQ